MTPDVNVLVAASRRDHPHHEVARAWLEQALRSAAGGAGLTLLPMVLASVLRLVTSARIFHTPTPMSDAVSFVDSLLANPGVRLAALSPEWPRLRQLCLDRQLAGNDVPDAWLAAAAIQSAEHLVSFDRGFRKWMSRSQFTLLRPSASD